MGMATLGAEIGAATRLNIGCGGHPLLGYCNIDCSMSAYADVYTSVPPIAVPDGALDEIYAGHYLEHLTRAEATTFLSECHRALRVGGKLGIVVPDMREIFRRYLDPEADARMQFPLGTWNDLHDLDAMYHMVVMSTVQDSEHKWGYDQVTLRRLLESHGFKVTGEINRWMDPRVSVGGWYQMGVDSVKV